jgi:hypothetical protein
MKRKNLIFAVVVLLAAVFSSCEKETDPSNECANMLYFENFDEFTKEMTKVQKMSLEEKIKWQESKGFKSLGVESDILYESINPSDFKDLEEIKQFVAKNSKYLQLIEENDEFSVEPIIQHCPFRYIVNNNHMFQIGENVYKAFDDITVSTDLKYQEEFKSMSLDAALLVSNGQNIEFNTSRLKSASYVCDYEDYDDDVEGRSKIELYIICYQLGSYVQTIYAGFEVTSKYKTIAWFRASRRITYDIKEKVMFKKADGNYMSLPWMRSGIDVESSHIQENEAIYAVIGSSNLDVHFEGFDCKAKVPATNYAICQCNVTIF